MYALTSEFDKSEWPNWSPDGSLLVLHRRLDEESRIFVINADGSNETAITRGANDYDPSWSPGGTQIAFARWAPQVENSGIYLMKPDGTGLVHVIREILTRAPTWSPDGTKLLFQVGTDPETRIIQVDVDGRNRKELTHGMTPSWQPILDGEPDTLSESPAESETVDSPN